MQSATALEEEDEEEEEHRFSTDSLSRQLSSSSSSLDSGCDSDCHAIASRDGRRRSSFSYRRLPEHPMKLSILKLDGSSFHVQVARSASVVELRLAVEEVFSQSPNEGQNKISWSHVWGHFCLCFDGYKLVDDKAFLRTIRIRDGDQLRFIRHLSIDYSPQKRRPKKSRNVFEQSHRSIAEADVHKSQNNSENSDRNTSNVAESTQLENLCCYEEDNNDNLLGHPEFRLAHFLQGWLSYARLWCMRKMKFDKRAQASRFARHYQRFSAREMQIIK